MTYDFAPHVVIDHDTHTLTVGGTEFPWCLTKEGPQVRHEGDTALVTLTFMADSAEVRPRSADGDTGTRAITAPAEAGELAEEVKELRATLAAIKAADPDLFDPTGGTDRGAAYETYGSAGEELREKFLAAIGVNVNDYDGVSDGE